MVSRNTSILLAVAIIAIGAVAIIGVAYAYTASTVNSGNTTDSEYVVLTQQESTSSATAKYSFGDTTIRYDTVTKYEGNPASVKTYYKLNGSSPIIVNETSYTVVSLGTVTLKATPTDNKTPAAALSVSVTSSGIATTEGWVFIISDGTNKVLMDSTDHWTGNLEIACVNSVWTATPVTLYCGYLTTSASTGLDTLPTNLNNTDTITFTAAIS